MIQARLRKTFPQRPDSAGFSLDLEFQAASGGIPQTEALDHFVHPAMTLQARPALRRELQVLAQRHVRKQGVVLKYVAAVAGLRRQMDSGGAVEQNVAVQ